MSPEQTDCVPATVVIPHILLGLGETCKHPTKYFKSSAWQTQDKSSNSVERDHKTTFSLQFLFLFSLEAEKKMEFYRIPGQISDFCSDWTPPASLLKTPSTVGSM